MAISFWFPGDHHERCRKWRLLLELHACQARGLGKICGQKLSKVKVLEKIENFEKVQDFEENTQNSYSNQCFFDIFVKMSNFFFENSKTLKSLVLGPQIFPRPLAWHAWSYISNLDVRRFSWRSPGNRKRYHNFCDKNLQLIWTPIDARLHLPPLKYCSSST